MGGPYTLQSQDKSGNRGTLHIWKLPFAVVRMFQISDVPPGEYRGKHAHKTCEQIIICTAGSFYLTTSAKTERRWYMRPGRAVYVPARHWITLDDFSADGTALVLASEEYTEPVSNWAEFYALINGDRDDPVC